MKYIGPLYAKLGGKYVKLREDSEHVDRIERENAELKARIDELERKEYKLKKDNIESLDLLAADTELQNRLADQIESKDKEIAELRKLVDIFPKLEVKEPYYPAKCRKCDWVGSSEEAIAIRGGECDDYEVLCPICNDWIIDDEPTQAEWIAYLLHKGERENTELLQLVERMKCCTNCNSRLWAATGQGDCQECNDFDKWAPQQSEAAERGE